jgi:catechol 2,3-dioxygenase-like lactoylglutathione lyase family enzyme
VFDHVTIRVADRVASLRFYDTVLQAIGIGPPAGDGEFPEWDDFSLAQAEPGKPVTRDLHIGFAARSRDDVHAFWQAGVDAGHRSDGEPGARPRYSPDYYGGFLLDPDGNSAEAVHHDDLRQGGAIDHIWIRVADLQAGKRAFEERGLRATFEDAGRVRFGGDNGSFSLVLGEPTEGLEIYFE